MARSRYSSERPIQYTVTGPALDMRRNRATAPAGVLTKCVGVDGRFSGSLRKFPGMIKLATLASATSPNTYSDVKFFKYVAIQKQGSATVLRGFVIHAKDAATSNYPIDFHYSTGSSFTRFEITANAGSTGDIDVATMGKYLYVAQSGVAPKVVFMTSSGTVTVAESMGVGSFAIPEVPQLTSQTGSGGVLEAGSYLVAYRYKSTERNIFSGLSVPLEVVIAADDSYATIQEPATAPPESSTNIEDYDAVEIYRTISNELAGNPYAGSLFYLAGTQTTITDAGATRTWTYDLGRTSADNMNDRILVQQQVYDYLLDAGGVAPQGYRIATYQASTFMGGTAGTGTGDSKSRLVWSPTHTFNPENFPAANLFNFPDVDDEVLTFVEVGDFLYACTKRVLYRIHKQGTRLSLSRLNYGRGLSGRHAAAGVDQSLLMMTPGGVLLIDGATGVLDIIGSLDRLVTDPDEWAGNLTNVSIAKDSAMGATFMLNPDKEEAAVLWDATNGVSRLEDMNFKFVTEGPLPTSAGVNLAFFVTDGGVVVYPNADRSTSSQKLTMLGVDSGTVNGTATSGSTTTVVDAGAAFDTSPGLAGCKVHVKLSTGWEVREISSNTSTAITVSSAFSASVASGIRYSVSPVPFRIRYWPLGSPNDGYPRSLFYRWNVKSIAAAITGLSTDADSDNDFLTLGVYTKSGASFAAEVEVALDTDPSDSYGAVAQAELLVEPGVDHVGSNTDFELTGVMVDITINRSRESTAS